MSQFTEFEALRRATGLRQADCVTFLGVALNTVKNWCSGRNKAPAGVLAEMRDLYLKQEAMIDKGLEFIDEILDGPYPPAVITLAVAKDDNEAVHVYELPCQSAHQMAIARLAALIDSVPVEITNERQVKGL